VSARTNPATGGRIDLDLQRFDPLSGWQYVASVDHAAVGGRTTFTLTPRLGAWRVHARYLGTLFSSPSSSGWITFTLEVASGMDKDAAVCSPGSAGKFTVGSMLVACGDTGFGASPGGPVTAGTTPSAGLRSLRTTVQGLATLKEPFRSQLTDDLDSAIRTLADADSEEARAQLDAFIATVQSPPVTAQLTADQRDRLITAARKIEAAIG
jgi:hypothetical protein